MEHRCGIRQTLNVGVKLYVRGSAPRFGRLLDASASGGYVATDPPLPMMSRVHLGFGWAKLSADPPHRIAAYIVRSDAHGIGIEWQEFAPPSLLALIEPLRVPPSQTERRALAIRRPSPLTTLSARSRGRPQIGLGVCK